MLNIGKTPKMADYVFRMWSSFCVFRQTGNGIISMSCADIVGYFLLFFSGYPLIWPMFEVRVSVCCCTFWVLRPLT